MQTSIQGVWRSDRFISPKGKEEISPVPYAFVFEADGSGFMSVADSPQVVPLEWKIQESRLCLRFKAPKERWKHRDFKVHSPNTLTLHSRGTHEVFQRISKEALGHWWSVRFAKRCKQVNYQDDEGRIRHFRVHYNFKRPCWFIHAYNWYDESGSRHELDIETRNLIVPRVVQYLHSGGWKDMVDVLYESPPNTALEPTATRP